MQWWAEWTEIRYEQNFHTKFLGLIHDVKLAENEEWGLIAYDTGKITTMDVPKHCLTPSGCLIWGAVCAKVELENLHTRLPTI